MKEKDQRFLIRLASHADVAALTGLIQLSVRKLQTSDYTQTQIESALTHVYGVDTQLINDGTYFVVESEGKIIGCGGWSKRKTLYGGDRWHGRQDAVLNPASEPAKIRAFFVHPEWARRGVGTLILDACEEAARAAGFRRLEMGATLSGVPFYEARGYEKCEVMDVEINDGTKMPIVRMAKEF